MDTQEILMVPEALPVELQAALDKHTQRQIGVVNREGWGASTGGKAVSQRYLGRLSDAIVTVCAAPPRRDRLDAHLIEALKVLDPDVVALCILTTVVSCLGHERDLMQTYVAVGQGLAGECWGAQLLKADAKTAKRIIRKAKIRHSAVASRRKAVEATAALKMQQFKANTWDSETGARAGAWGVHLMLEALDDVFSIRSYTSHTAKGARTVERLELSEAAWSVVDEALNAAVVNHPVFFPSLVPPKPWDAWSGCGPVDPRVNGIVTFLRTGAKEVGAAMRAAIRTGQAKPALDGVNTLQGVAWTVNTRILDIITECSERGIVVPGLPQWQDLPIPAKLPDVVWAGMDEDRQRFVRMRKAEMHQLNRSAKNDRIMFAEDMKIAQSVAVQDQFYTPMSCDWRGRVYSVTHFNFQREDRVRALFQFRDGEPIGEEGLYWLKVHVANCGAFNKIDKQPMEERVQWVDQNLPLLIGYVSEPMIRVHWMQADSPFLFLAACMELVRCMNGGPATITNLPVSFDGSCSGLQHLCAMTRAEEGSLVNLTPSVLPQDIYEAVADLVRESVTLDLDHEPENTENADQVKASDRIRALARLTLDYGVTRKLVKRNVMTYAYSSKQFGMASQLQVDLMAPLAREVLEGNREEHPFAPYQDGDVERPSAGSRYLAARVFSAIEAKVQKPSEAMKFLQKLARALAHEGKPLRWTTPVGLPWINRYHNKKTKRVELFLQNGGVNVRKQITVAVADEPEINKDKAANGVAPNFVHALDAAHLLLVANRASAEGITQIATVHDSFGCLPSSATRFRRIIQEEFLRMYETHDVLDQVFSQATCDLTHTNHHMLPDAIEYGTLNLTEILDAQYAFA